MWEGDLNCVDLWVKLKFTSYNGVHAYNIFGLPIRPYVALYPWVDANGVNIVGSASRFQKIGSETIPIKGPDRNIYVQISTFKYLRSNLVFLL